MDTAILAYAGGLAAGGLAMGTWAARRQRSRAQALANQKLLEVILQGQRPTARQHHPSAACGVPNELQAASHVLSTPRILRGVLDAKNAAGGSGQTQRPLRADPQLASLEGLLRSAILGADARERLVRHAMHATGGDRAAAIRQVLEELDRENKRWS